MVVCFCVRCVLAVRRAAGRSRPLRPARPHLHFPSCPSSRSAGANYTQESYTPEGVGALCQCNYLGPYALTRQLEDALQASALARVGGRAAAGLGLGGRGWGRSGAW